MKVLLRLLALIQKLIENGYEINEFGETQNLIIDNNNVLLFI